MESVIKDIKNTTQKKYMDYGKNPGSPDNDFLFMYSVPLNTKLIDLKESKSFNGIKVAIFSIRSVWPVLKAVLWASSATRLYLDFPKISY
uniref:Uncharacterized protein n=1 Tax=Sinocyclocheilus anshuiensis TaxID=1608454 RepID=A0A671KV69_9TELE